MSECSSNDCTHSSHKDSKEVLVDIQNQAIEPVKDEIDEFLDSVPDAQVAPEDMLAAFYERHLEAVKHNIELLGKNALKRIILNVLMGEFAPKEYQPNISTKKGRAEKSVAFHFNEGVERRMLLRFEMEFGKAQEAYEKEMADLKKIEEMNKLSPEAQAVLDNMNNSTLETVLGETNE